MNIPGGPDFPNNGGWRHLLLDVKGYGSISSANMDSALRQEVLLEQRVNVDFLLVEVEN